MYSLGFLVLQFSVRFGLMGYTSRRSESRRRESWGIYSQPSGSLVAMFSLCFSTKSYNAFQATLFLIATLSCFWGPLPLLAHSGL